MQIAQDEQNVSTRQIEILISQLSSTSTLLSVCEMENKRLVKRLGEMEGRVEEGRGEGWVEGGRLDRIKVK